MSVKIQKVGEHKGKDVYSYLLDNENGLKVEIFNLGGIVKRIIFKDTDVALGYETPADYISGDTYFGALIGRNSNRIAKGEEGKAEELLGMHKSGAIRNTAPNADVINVVNKGSLPKDDKQYVEKTRALLLSTLFYDRKLCRKYIPQIDESMFVTPIHKVIFSYIKECSEKDEKTSNTALMAKFDTNEEINEASGILALDVQSDDTDRAVSDYIKQIKEKSGVQRALELMQSGALSLEEFNAMINNKG